MEPKALQTFKDLLKIRENNFCFECGAAAEEWVSVNNGIFLCDKCATIHRKFGLNISAVRSFVNDNWSDLHLAMMANGGNNKLRDFLNHYYVPKDGPMDFKYKTKAGFHYRKRLRALAEGVTLPDFTDVDTALELEEDINPDQVPDFEVGYETTPPKTEKGLEKMYSFLEKAFDQTVLKTKETAQILNDKIKNQNIGQEMKQGVTNMGTAVLQETKNVANIISDKLKDPELKQSFKGVGDKIASGAKKGAEEFIGFFRKLSGGQDMVQPKVHIDENKLETVYSVENTASTLSKTTNTNVDTNKENLNPSVQ